MAEPYVGEIRMFAGNFAPAGWMFCEGQVLAIAENDILFNLIGITYGGDGQETFALPDLRGRIPIHVESFPHPIGEAAGVETVTITVPQMPGHAHVLLGSSAPADASAPASRVLARSTSRPAYAAGPPVAMAASIQGAGGSLGHENVQPFLCVSFIISLFGVYPSPT